MRSSAKAAASFASGRGRFFGGISPARRRSWTFTQSAKFAGSPGVNFNDSKSRFDSLRTSLSRQLLRQTSATLEAYAYLYDHAVLGYRSSSVYAATLAYEPSVSWRFLWGASVARTPYAALDAQTLLRVVYDFGSVTRGGR